MHMRICIGMFDLDPLHADTILLSLGKENLL